MGQDVNIYQGFVEPRPEPPRKMPVPRRRVAFSLVLAGAIAATGGLVLLLRLGNCGRGHPMPKPGPRRYPPGYRPKTEAPRPTRDPH